MDRISPTSRTRVAFEKVPRPVELENARELLPILDSVFRHWPRRVIGDEACDDPVITITAGDRGRYWLRAPWLDEPVRYSNGVNLACGLGVNINQALLAGPDEYLCLHTAAAEIGGRLVIFPNTYRAGKSTLTVCLAAAGARIFCDDILPVVRRSGRGMALGIAPRPRLPWPANLAQRTVDFIAARKGAENSQYLYVDLEKGEQAPFGDTAPFGGVVLLNRREDAPAVLEPISLAAALKHVVLRNFARRVPMAASLDRICEMLTSCYCARLTFSNSDEAADLLMERLEAREPVPMPDREIKQSNASPADGPNGLNGIGEVRLSRRDGVRERMVDGELFLVDSSERAIYHLNAVGTGLWRLLDGACGIDEVIGILDEAFPEAGREKIERDVTRLVSDLLACELLVEVSARGQTPRSADQHTGSSIHSK